MLKKALSSAVVFSLLSFQASAECGRTYQRGATMAKAKVGAAVLAGGVTSTYGLSTIGQLGAAGEAAFMIGLAGGGSLGATVTTIFYKHIDPRETTSMNRVLRELRVSEYGGSQIDQVIRDIESNTGIRPEKKEVVELIRDYNASKLLCPVDDVIMPYSGVVKKLADDLGL